VLYLCSKFVCNLHIVHHTKYTELKGKDLNTSDILIIIHRMKTTVEANKCNKCGKIWVKRKDNPNEEPVVCPKCKSAYWNKPRLE